MPFVRTVLGDIAPTSLGVCCAHEHLAIAPSFPTAQSPDFLLDDLEKQSEELCGLYESGARACIDSMPCDCGRDVLLLAELSRRSKLHIVAPTGLHLEKYYPPGHWGQKLNEDELAALFIADIEEGIDALDYSGPLVRRTTHRAGVIKVAGGRDKLSAHERKVFRAAAHAQRATGCPILTHTEAGTAALEQVQVLADAGADLSHVVLSHLDRNLDPEAHRQVLERGVVLEYDSAFRWKNSENHTLELLIKLLPEFPRQIVLGMDAARRSYWKCYSGAPGLRFLLDEFVPMMKARGISDAHIHQVLVSTPARVFAFGSAARGV
jgi:phosphotriesterase-related protein